MGFLANALTELKQIGQAERRRALADMTASNIDADTAQRIGQMSVWHPWLPLGAQIGLARAGYGPMDDAVTNVSKEVIQATATKSVMGYAKPGDTVRVSSLTPEQRDLAVSRFQQNQNGYFQQDAGLAADPELQRRLSMVPGGGAKYQAATPAERAEGARKILDAPGSMFDGDSGLISRATHAVTDPVSNFARDNPVTNNVLEPGMRHTLTGQNPVARGVRGVTRVATATLQAPVQLVQAEYRSQRENIRNQGYRGWLGQGFMENQGNLGGQIDLGQILRGKDTGSGFFVNPESEAGKERRQFEVDFGGTYANGQVRTIGRDFADVFTEPGSKEFNILSGFGDAAVALGTDAVTVNPLQEAHAAAGAFRSAENAENAMGLIRGARFTYDPGLVDAYVSSGKGIRTAEKLAGVASMSEMDALTGGKLTPALVKRLVEETDPGEIQNIMRNTLGISWREAPNTRLASLGFTVKDTLGQTSLGRLGSKMPTLGLVDLENPREVLTQVKRTLENVKAPRETIDRFMLEMADANGKGARFGVWKSIMADTADRLAVEQGYEPGVADRLTKIFTKSLEDDRLYNIDAIGENRQVLGVMHDGKMIAGKPELHLVSEMLDKHMPMPDPRELRLAFSDPVTKALLSFKPTEVGVSTALALQDKVWKPAALLRGAWTLRVLGEEQLRIAASGLSSMVNHPFSYIAYMLGDEGRVSRMMEKWGVEGRAVTDIHGGMLKEQDEFAAAMFHGRAGLTDEGRIHVGGFTRYRRDVTTGGVQDGFFGAAHDELATLAADPVGQVVARTAFNGEPVPRSVIDVAEAGAARGTDLAVPVSNVPARATAVAENPLLAAQDWMWNEGKWIREELAKNNPTASLDILNNRAHSDEYVQSVFDRIKLKTGDNPDLINAVATGRLSGESLFIPGSPHLNPKATKALEGYVNDLPEIVRGPRTITAKGVRDGSFDGLKRGVDVMFSGLMTKPANYLSRSQVWRQSYVEEMLALAPKLDPGEAADLLKWAEANNLSKVDTATIRSAVGRHAGEDAMSLDTIDTLAKGKALDRTKELLYDLADKSQFFDVFRLLFPFGEAWGELITRWPKLIAERPKALLTAKRVLEGGRNPTVGALVGAPKGQGAFYRDANGEERFAFALTGQLLGLVGLPEVPLTGRLAGLSLMSEVLPGVGPLGQIGAAALVPDTPAFEGVRSLLFPYGAPTDLSDPGAALNEMLPAWARTFTRGSSKGGYSAEGQRAFANETINVARYLVASGEFQIANNPNSSAELTRLVGTSKDQAGWMTMIRGLAQNVAPSAPMYEWYIKVPDGRKLPMLTLVEDYRQMQDEDFENATVKFLQKYGDNAFLLMQNKSITVSPGIAAPTKEANDWLRANPWAMKEYGTTYGFFAPTGGEFSSDAYQQQLELQDRQPLTIEEFVKRGNNLIGQSIYYRYRDKFPAKMTPDQSAFMQDLDAKLRQNYEGYGDEAGVTGKANTDELIDELSLAVQDKRLNGNATADSVQKYLKLRASVITASKANLTSATSYQAAKEGAGLRALLSQGADQLIAENPDFAPVWERVFRDEIDAGLKKDDEGQ